jgi:Na+/phosphate symporter
MTTKKDTGKLASIREDLYKLAHKSAEVLQLISEGFNLHSGEHLENAIKLAKEVDDAHVELTDALLEELDKHKDELDEVKQLIPIPGQLERIGDDCESIIAVTRTKIKEGTLFSDKAASEVNYIFKNLIGLIKSTGDIILTRNQHLKKHIIEETINLSNKADDSATLHQERLVLGVCNPKSAPMFLDILDSLKGVAYHLRNIAETIL